MGLITLTHNPGDIQNGQTADASDIIQNFQDIVNEVNGNIDTVNLANLAVTTAKLAELAVTAVKIAADAVETAKIKDLNVTAAKLAADAVETVKIKDAAVTLDKLGLNAFIETVLDDEDAATALTTLGFSAYVQTLKGAADLAAFLTAMGVDLDDISDGTTYKRTPTAAVGNYLKSAGAGVAATFGKLALGDTGVHIGNSARTTAGDQVITGIGFQPSVVLFFAVDTTVGNINLSWGFDTLTSRALTEIRENGTKNSYTPGYSIEIYRDISNWLVGLVSAVGADGFTITWTLTGNCGANFIYCCLP